MSKPSLLLNLPPELVVEVLVNLSATDLASCRCTDKALNNLIESNVLLQYSIELEVAGAKDNPASSLVLADKLRLLRGREQAWRRLDLPEVTSIPVRHSPSGIYDLTRGVFLLGERSRQSSRRSTDGLKFIKISSIGAIGTERGDGHISWSTIKLERPIIDIGLSAQEHDLIAVVTYEFKNGSPVASIDIHLLNLSTGSYHPSASRPIIHVEDIHFVVGQCSISLEISGSTLGLLINHHFMEDAPRSASFNLYNWMTGKRKLYRAAVSSTYNSFAFLSPDAIVLPNATEKTLELCRLPHDQSDSSITDPVPLQTTCTLALPSMVPISSIIRISCRCEPNPTGPASEATYQDTSSPFHPDPADAIIIFNLFVQEDQNAIQVHLHAFTLVVHRSALLEKLLSSPLPTNAEVISSGHEAPERSPPELPWHIWGPPICRWFNSSFMATRWITTTCGQRYVTIRRSPAPIEIFDFNQAAIRRILSECQNVQDSEVSEESQFSDGFSPDGWRQHSPDWDDDEPAFVDAVTQVEGRFVMDERLLYSQVFTEPVVSSLPYMSLTTFGDYAYDSVLIDEEGLIGLKLDEFGNNIREIVVHKPSSNI